MVAMMAIEILQTIFHPESLSQNLMGGNGGNMEIQNCLSQYDPISKMATVPQTASPPEPYVGFY